MHLDDAPLLNPTPDRTVRHQIVCNSHHIYAGGIDLMLLNTFFKRSSGIAVALMDPGCVAQAAARAVVATANANWIGVSRPSLRWRPLRL